MAGFWVGADSVRQPPPDTAATMLVVDSVRLDLGQVGMVPIRLMSQRNLTADTVDMVLHLEATCAEIRNGTVRYVADTAVVQLMALRSAMDGSVLAHLQVRARLGSVTGTVVRVQEARWRGQPAVVTSATSGAIDINGICMEGGRARLVRDTELAVIQSVAPNPARSSIRVTVSATTSRSGEVRLVDVMGRVRSAIPVTLSATGHGDVLLHCDEETSGMYVVQFLTSATMTSTSVMVQR